MERYAHEKHGAFCDKVVSRQRRAVSVNAVALGICLCQTQAFAHSWSMAHG